MAKLKDEDSLADKKIKIDTIVNPVEEPSALNIATAGSSDVSAFVDADIEAPKPTDLTIDRAFLVAKPHGQGVKRDRDDEEHLADKKLKSAPLASVKAEDSTMAFPTATAATPRAVDHRFSFYLGKTVILNLHPRKIAFAKAKLAQISEAEIKDTIEEILSGKDTLLLKSLEKLKDVNQALEKSLKVKYIFTLLNSLHPCSERIERFLDKNQHTSYILDKVNFLKSENPAFLTFNIKPVALLSLYSSEILFLKLLIELLTDDRKLYTKTIVRNSKILISIFEYNIIKKKEEFFDGISNIDPEKVEKFSVALNQPGELNSELKKEFQILQTPILKLNYLFRIYKKAPVDKLLAISPHLISSFNLINEAKTSSEESLISKYFPKITNETSLLALVDMIYSLKAATKDDIELQKPLQRISDEYKKISPNIEEELDIYFIRKNEYFYKMTQQKYKISEQKTATTASEVKPAEVPRILAGAGAGAASAEIDSIRDGTADAGERAFDKLENIILTLSNNDRSFTSAMLMPGEHQIVTSFIANQRKINIKSDGNCLYNAVLFLAVTEHPEKVRSAFPDVPMDLLTNNVLRNKIAERIRTVSEEQKALYFEQIKNSILDDIVNPLDLDGSKLNKYDGFSAIFKRIKEYAKTLDQAESELSSQLTNNNIMDAYEVALLKPGSFGGELEIKILTEILNLDILITSIQYGSIVSNNTYAQTREKYITIHHNGDHFDAVISEHSYLKIQNVSVERNELTTSSDDDKKDHPIAGGGSEKTDSRPIIGPHTAALLVKEVLTAKDHQEGPIKTD